MKLPIKSTRTRLRLDKRQIEKDAKELLLIAHGVQLQFLAFDLPAFRLYTKSWLDVDDCLNQYNQVVSKNRPEIIQTNLRLQMLSMVAANPTVTLLGLASAVPLEEALAECLRNNCYLNFRLRHTHRERARRALVHLLKIPVELLPKLKRVIESV